VSNSFGFPPSPQNYIAPGKAPMSSMVPTMVLRDGKLYIVAGAAGGSRIITSTSQVILNVLYGMDAYQAVSAPRCHDQLIPNQLKVEHDYPQAFVDQFKSEQYEILLLPKSSHLAATTCIVVQEDNLLQAASDPRKYSLPAGY
jgi:gamma-glutamyltranspeptidase